MKKAFNFIVLLSIILFASCKNFMDSSQIKNQIEDSIRENNAKNIKLVISQDTTMGSFLSSGDKVCKLGYSIDLQFNLKKESYIFKGIKAVSSSDNESSRNDCIEFTITDRDDDKGIYKISIKVIKDASDIMIVPDCILVPGIVKEDCFPSFDASGWEQDSTIRIAFNKPVAPSEAFAVIITDIAGQDMSSFYGEPFFSADKKTLFIPINKAKRIIREDENISTKDIIVKIDLTTIQDEEENTGSGLFEYKFRVNKTKDMDLPVFVSANVYTSSDKTRQVASSYPWASEAEYHANHLRNSVYVEFKATDEGSGIGGILVKEKVIKYPDGSSASESEEAVSYHSDDTCVLNETTGNYVLNYTIGTLSDGIIQLQIFAEDYSFNHSTGSKTVYVLKDTTIEGGRIKFLQEFDSGNWLTNLPEVMENDNDKQEVVLQLSPDAKDYFFDNYATDYELKVSWKYENETDNNYKLVSKNNENKYVFIRDVSKLIFIKVECKDYLGNTKTLIKRMAPRVEVQYLERGFNIVNLQSLLLLCDIHDIFGMDLSTSLRDYFVPMYCYYCDDNNYYEVIDTGDPNGPEIQPVEPQMDLRRCYASIQDTNKPPVPVGSFRIYLIPSFGDFPAPISINYIYGNIISDNEAGAAYNLSEMQASSSIKGTINSGQEGPEGVSYFNENFRITTKPLEDLGCYRVKIEDYMTPAGKANNVSYTFLAVAWQKKDPNTPFVTLLWGQSTRSKNPEFLLRSESNYVIYVEGTDSNGNTYIPRTYPPSYTDTAHEEVLNNSYRFYLNSGTTPIQVLDLTKDLSAPYLPKNNNPFNGDPGCYTIPIPQDGNPESPLYTGPSIIKNKYGNAELAYYIIPVPTGNRKYVPSYTIEELETYYKDIKQTIEFPYDPDQNSTEGKIRVPYDDLKDGFYTISFVTQDVNNNKAVETYPFIKNNLGKLPYSFEYNGMGYEFTLNPTKNPEIKLVGENLDKPSVEVYLQRCIENSETQPSDWEGYLSDKQIVYTSGQDQFGNACFTKFLDGTPATGPLFDTCFTPNEGKWFRIKAFYGFNDSDSTSGKGFYDMEYIFIGNPACEVKNCIEGLNGIVVYCDNTVLAHTLYSKTKLTRSKYEKDAASIWENKGAETGVWILNTTPWRQKTRPDDGQPDGWEQPVKMITYNASNYDFVPTGYYFVTVFHFADGTVTMTDIKQKD